METIKNVSLSLGALIVLGLLLLGVYRMTCLTFVEVHEFSYKVNHLNGGIEKVKQQNGYIRHLPIVESIYTIDQRPFQIRVSANNRVSNQKLIRFNPDG